MKHTHIIGLGGYLPEQILHNKDLPAALETSDAWIRERTGIEQRHIAAEGQFTSDLATAAAKQALEDAGLTIDDIDAIIVATTTPDMVFPSTASIVQFKLGATSIPAWDIQAVCSGFVYGLAQVDGMMRGGMFERVLLIGAERMSHILDWSDRSTCVLFGDGAGAVVLEYRDDGTEHGVIGSTLHADGAYRDLLMANHAQRNQVIPGFGGQNAPDLRLDSAGVAAVEMRGNEVFRTAVKQLGAVVDEVLELHGLTHNDLDHLIPHQANLRIIQATAKKLKMSLDHVAVTVNKHANTSAASVPLAMHALYQQNAFKAGDLLLLEAFGAGFVWGANLVRWSKQ
ncbi:MAG: ketoacyl-ACP synthase III [Zetaproteobacteria bacterium]|nr:ketoacyl-ACP synthase III [Zetaproteobacteria bacterium]